MNVGPFDFFSHIHATADAMCVVSKLDWHETVLCTRVISTDINAHMLNFYIFSQKQNVYHAVNIDLSI